MKLNYGSYPMYEVCKEHMHAYVMAELADNSRFDGIVTGLDQEFVYFAVPVENQRPQAPDGYPEWRNDGQEQPRRFNRIIVPINGVKHLQRLSWY